MKIIHILGSGPVGVITASFLLSKGYRVTLIDNSSEESQNIKNERSFTLKKFKNVFSDNIVTFKKGKATLPVSSGVVGGYSEVWGGTLDIFDEEDFKTWDLNNQNLKKYYLYILKSLDLPIYYNQEKQQIKNIEDLQSIEDIYINIYEKYQKNKERINRSKVYFKYSTLFLKNNKIWSSRILLQELKEEYKKSFKHIDNFEASDIEEENNRIVIKSDTKSIEILDSKLFIAAGALSSSLLACKFLNEENFKLKNSDLKVVPIIWMGGKGKTESTKTYPQLYINFLRKDKYTIRTQVYNLNNNLLKSLNLNEYFIKSIKAFNYLVGKRIFLMFVYSHSSESSFSSFRIVNDVINHQKINTVKNNNFKYIFSKLFKITLSSKLIPIPVYKKFTSYGSFHYGSSLSGKVYENDTIKVNEYGQLNSKSDIHFIDSSIMRDIPSGPITFSSMAIALNVVDKSL